MLPSQPTEAHEPIHDRNAQTDPNAEQQRPSGTTKKKHKGYKGAAKQQRTEGLSSLASQLSDQNNELKRKLSQLIAAVRTVRTRKSTSDNTDDSAAAPVDFNATAEELRTMDTDILLAEAEQELPLFQDLMESLPDFAVDDPSNRATDDAAAAAAIPQPPLVPQFPAAAAAGPPQAEPTVPAAPAAPVAAPAPPSGQISGEIAKILGGRSHFVKKNHIKTHRHHNRRNRHKTLKNKA